MAKKTITARLDEGLVKELDRHRSQGNYKIDRTRVIELGIQYAIMVNDQRDGALELLEDTLSYQKTDIPEWYSKTILQALSSITKEFCENYGADKTREVVEAAICGEGAK